MLSITPSPCIDLQHSFPFSCFICWAPLIAFFIKFMVEVFLLLTNLLRLFLIGLVHYPLGRVFPRCSAVRTGEESLFSLSERMDFLPPRFLPHKLTLSGDFILLFI